MPKLSRQEDRVANLLLNAMSNQEIAQEMHITVSTVKRYMNRIFLKYGISGGIQRVKLAVILHRERCPDCNPLVRNSQNLLDTK